MDVVPDSEPSRLVDGPMSSLHLQVSDITNGKNRVVPESSGEADIETSEHNNPDRSAQDTKAQDTEADTEQEDDPMDSDRPLVKQRPKRPPKPAPEEEEEEEEVQQGAHDDTTVPETEDEVPLAIKTTKAVPKPLPPRGRSMRNKRPIIYTESPDTSENEVSTIEIQPVFIILSCLRKRKRNRKRLLLSAPPRRGKSKR